MSRPKSGISVDGSSRGNPGPAKYKGVDLSTGEILFEIDIKTSTNNIAEFIGLVHALDYALKNGYDSVYSDSNTAISWVNNKAVKTTLKINDENKYSLDLMTRALSHLDKLKNYKPLIKKWETSKWGESPADFGYK